jgi:hypothetical protein
MRARHLLVVLGLAALALPATAFAGAPNYDCSLDHGRMHLAIDQWTPLVVGTGFGSTAAVQAGAQDVDQNGPTLGFTTSLGGRPWKIAISGYGRSIVMTGQGAHRTGHCLMIPGNFVLRAADRGGHVVRKTPFPTAARVASLSPGGPVWQRPAHGPKGRWIPALVVTFPAGAAATRSGWLRQIGPYESR